jgi:hypothetical protein
MWKTLGYAALMAAVGAGGASAAEAPAAAATSTVVYVCGMTGYWQCPQARPGEIAFGAHYDLVSLRWTAWRALDATGHGHFYAGSCIDAPCYSYNANVKLYYVKAHDGHRYFAWLRITARHHATRRLHYYGGFWHTA